MVILSCSMKTRLVNRTQCLHAWAKMSRHMAYILSAFLLLVSKPALSQGSVESIIQQYAPTPQALSVVKGGQVNVNGNTGKMSLQVPVGEYSDRDFTIPISLDYSYDGFKPASPSGAAGLGWSLSAGGCISREIVGVDDFGEYGYYYASHYSSLTIYNMQHSVSLIEEILQPTLGDSHETTSDIYHFSFPGHSGSFVIDNNGHFAPYGTSGEGGTYSIMYDDDTFTIKTSDGTTWRFGSIDSSREIMLKQNGILEQYPHQLSPLDGELPVTTWLLDRITAPNGRIAEFSYTSSRTYNSIPSEGMDDVITTFGRGDNSSGSTTRYKFASLVYTSYLTSITVKELSGTSKTVAAFTWERKNYREINDTELFDYRKMIVCTRRLTGITVQDGTAIIRTASLSYNDNRGRPLLTSVTIPVYGTWSFEYNLPSGSGRLPGQLSNAVDFWGYYNGKNTNPDNLIAPTTVNATSLNESLNTYNMDPDGAYSQLGSIKKINWPTGGSSSIVYEAHDAKKILLRRRNPTVQPIPQPEDRSGAAFTTSLENVSVMLHNNLCGGIRVKSITDDDVVNGTSTRSFGYKDASGVSTGIIQEFNRYFAGKSGIYDMMNPFLKYPGNSFDENHIAYTSILETLSDGSSTRTDYTSWVDNPDEFSPHYIVYNSTPSGFGDTYDLFIDNIQRVPDSRAYRRGLPIKTTLSDAQGNIVREETFSYTDRGNTYAAYVIGSGHKWWSARWFIADRVLQTVNTVFYPAPGKALPSSESYTYDTYGRKTSVIITDSDNSRTTTAYTYLDTTVQPSLVTRTTQSTRPVGIQTENLTEATDFCYQQSGSLWNLISETHTLYNISGAGTVTDITLYSQHDQWGNPRELSYNGECSAILWAYNGRYPAATVRNCTFLSLPYILKTSNTGNLSTSQIESIYSLSGDKEARAFLWSPSVGITKTYDVAGRSTVYEYDNLKRLSAIKDGDNVLLKSYSYNDLTYSPTTSLKLLTASISTGSNSRTEKQVYDGLGRNWVSTDGDRISLSKYDGLGRLIKSYLPYSGSTLYLNMAYTLQRLSWGYEEGEYAFSSTSYSGGPMALPVNETLPGKAIHTAGKSTVHTRTTNTSYEVPKLICTENATALGTSTSVSIYGYYPEGTLLKTTTTSEDGEILVVYETALGREVLSRRRSGTDNLDTYTVKDRYGRTYMVVTPLLGSRISTLAAAGADSPLTGAETDSGTYRYYYDDKGNLTGVHNPGKSRYFLTFNNAHKPVTETPASSSQVGNCLYLTHSYDSLSRITATQLYRNSLIPFDPPHKAVQPEALLGTLSQYQYATPGITYSIPSALSFVARPGIVSSADSHIAGSLILESQWPINEPVKPLDRRVGFLGWNYGDNMLGGTPAQTAYYYDSYGRVSQAVTSWYDGGLTRISTSYDLEGRVLCSLEEHTPPGSASTDWIWTENTYNSHGEVISTSVWTGSGTAPDKQDAVLTETISFTYDDIGRVTARSLSSSGNSISQTYSYTVQGWTSQSTSMLGNTAIFTENLYYWNPIKNQDHKRYGGMISEATFCHGSYPARTESYTYDGFDRVTGTSAYIGDSLQATDVNTEKDISYGPVGNVTALIRCGSDGTPVSQMSMNYSGSRLNSVSDAVSGQSWTRSYKDDGSLYYEGKTDRYYTDNIIGMTAKVYSDEPFLNYDYTPVATYIYLPDGTKVEARNINFAANTLYRGSFIYSKTSNSPASLKSIILPGMVVSVSGSTWTPLAFVTDHLDNVRAVVDMQSATVVERNDYYPYGGRITQPSDTSAAYPSASANRWRLAGKEEQDTVTGLPISDFGARMYDPFTATWLTQDPMATDYPGIGPYVFCAGNPVNLVDRDGRRIRITRHFNKITISANYYATDRASYNAAKQGVAFWNRRTDDLYIDESGHKYKIQYRLTVTEANSIDDSKQHDNTFEINDYQVDILTTKEASGVTADKQRIFIKKAYATTKPGTTLSSSTAAHEIGHTLGMEHEETGIMSEYQNEKRSGYVSQENINRMIDSDKYIISSETTWITRLFESITHEFNTLSRK